MWEIFQYSFMVRALLAGLLAGLVAPAIGTFLVARRYSLVADSFSHIALAGVAVGLITGLNPVLAALGATLIAAMFIEKLRSERRVAGDTALAIFLSSGLALAVVLIGLAKGFNADLLSYLFGSITTVRALDVWVMFGLAIIVAATLAFLYKELVFVSFDEQVARVSGVATQKINFILILLTALTVVLAMRIVGVLLIGALVVIPAASAMQIARSFRQSLFFAVAFGLISVLAGLFLSYYLDLSSGGTIVLSALVIFVLTLLFSKKSFN